MWCFVLCCVAWFGCESPNRVAPSAQSVEVTVGAVIQQEIRDFEEFTGRTSAPETVELRSRDTGYLDRIEFADGAEVGKGDLLFVIDPRPFQAEYDKSVAQIAVCKANLDFREAELARNKDLVQSRAVSRSEFDQSAAAYEQAKASLEAAKATAESTKLGLEFTEIRSPIKGVASRTSVSKGNLVLADQTLLTTIVSVDPMHIYFDVDERKHLHFEERVRAGSLQIGDGHRLDIIVGLATEEGYPHSGTIDFADNRIDPNTGTIQVRGVLDNPAPKTGRRVLKPGLFARVRVPIGEPHQGILIAEQAIGSDQGQKYVFVVDENKAVQYRRVRLGRMDSGLRVVSEGLAPGEQVIIAGLQRVRPGITVQPHVADMESYRLSNASAGVSSANKHQ
jgi:RND family efflux transporter MFP subunit